MLESNYLKNAIIKSRHTLPSIISSLDDDSSTQSCNDLIKIVANSSIAGCQIKIDCSNEKPDSIYFNVYPGEHYKFLAGIILTVKPKCLVDIGTFTGMSSRIMLDHTSAEAEIHTFDILEFDKFNSHLNTSDFEERNFSQHIDDLSQPKAFGRYIDLLSRADMIFCDAPKDGMFEYEFLELLSGIDFPKKDRLLLLDDIRFENMWMLWRSINSPKIDATSVAHWSGTGIVDISEGLLFEKSM